MKKRKAITGVPRSGKTTLAQVLGVPYRSTDDTMGLGWSGSSSEVAKWFDEPGDLVVEGVAVPRALRKWLKTNPFGRPVDVVEWKGSPHGRLTPDQEAMGKGCETVMREIAPELRRRGVEITGLDDG